MSAESPDTTPLAREAADIARRFVEARKSCAPLSAYPGNVPGNLADAYRIQDAAIELWDQPIGGWKVGRIPPAVEADFGIDRLAGPIFADTIYESRHGTATEMPVFAGGFAAIEAEYVAVIAEDIAPGKSRWSLQEAASVVSDLRIGLEIASSPLSTINELGPAVVVSDFGNNLGLIVGPSIRDWRDRPLESMHCRTFVGDDSVGDGGAFRLTGGFLRSVQFILELLADRGLALKAGDVIATGQTTGIHEVVEGQAGLVDFGDDGSIRCRITTAKP